MISNGADSKRPRADSTDGKQETKRSKQESSPPLQEVISAAPPLPPQSAAEQLRYLDWQQSAKIAAVLEQAATETKSPEAGSSRLSDIPSRPPKEYHRRQSEEPSHQTILDRSIEHIPQEAIATFRELNKRILEANVKFKSEQTEHLAKSKREILQTATVALNRVAEGQSKKALLFGVGNGLDTPLQELAEKFDHLRLVELDSKSTENAIKQLPSELQTKIELVVADITGINGELCRSAQEFIDSSGSLKQYYDLVTKKMDSIEEKITESTLDLGTDYAFVSSQLVLSQLGSIPGTYILNVGKSKFSTEASIETENAHNNFLKSYSRMSDILQKKHIQSLEKSVTPQGTVHLADTYERKNPSSEPKLVLNTHTINQVIQENFKPIKAQTLWIFEHTPNRLQFLVMSHSLERRSNDQAT